MGILFVIVVFIFVGLWAIAGSGSNKLIYPNGRPNRAPFSNKIYINGYKDPEHGAKVMVGNLDDFFNGTMKLKYYNANTDEFQDNPVDKL